MNNEKLHIIIEGPDGSGKSTIVKKLSKHFGFPILKMPVVSKVFKSDIELCSFLFNSVLTSFSNTDFICDRGYLSSIVYSKVYGRKTDLSYIENVAKKLKPIIFVLTATDKVLKERRNKDKFITDEFRVKVRNEYENLINRKNKNEQLYLVNTSDRTINEIFGVILSLIYTRNE